MVTNWRVNWTILKTCVEEKLVYRSDFAFATFVRFLPIVTQIFLWGAIYGAEPNRIRNGYTYADMVAYYLLAMVARAFSSMPGLAGGIAREIRDGTVKKYLTQPIDMLGYLFWHRVAHKLVYYCVATGPFVVMFYLCRDYFHLDLTAFKVSAWVVSLIMAFLIGFLIESMIGLIGFWFLEVSSLIFVYMMINFFLSGHMIPLDWLGDRFVSWMTFSPFKFLAYTPATILLKDYSQTQILFELAIGAGWIVVLLCLNRMTFHLGVKRYGAFGG